jgi:hypothetical protein
MSVQITTSMVESYKDNMYHLTQQKGSRLRRGCRLERVVGKTHYFDQLGATSARLRTSRHADTPRMDTPHSRRRVALNDYDWGDLIDNEDQIRLLGDPTSMYAEAGAMAMGRSMDDAIIAAADGTAYTGVDGSTSTAYDTGMTVAVNTRWPGVSDANLGLNVAKLLEAGRLLGAGNVDPDEEKFCIVNAAQVKSLLMDARVSSHDYNAIKPLVNGQISQFGGFTMIPTERIGLDASSYHKVIYWAKNGLALGIGQDITVRIGERADKNYATQVFCAMSIGATRLEEARVGLILCHATNGPG